MALFTHSYASRLEAEVNPAEAYFSEAVICRNYVESRSAKYGTRYSAEHDALEAQGFRFMAHVPGLPGKMSTDILMVKPTPSAVEANAQAYGSDFSGFEIFTSETLGEKCRIEFSYDWGNNYHPRVIAGDCVTAEMLDHLVALSGSEDARRAITKEGK